VHWLYSAFEAESAKLMKTDKLIACFASAKARRKTFLLKIIDQGVCNRGCIFRGFTLLPLSDLEVEAASQPACHTLTLAVC
jgi:hypothetical protein